MDERNDMTGTVDAPGGRASAWSRALRIPEPLRGRLLALRCGDVGEDAAESVWTSVFTWIPLCTVALWFVPTIRAHTVPGGLALDAATVLGGTIALLSVAAVILWASGAIREPFGTLPQPALARNRRFLGELASTGVFLSYMMLLFAASSVPV